MIAGKGHEQGQEFAGGRKEPFDDVAVAREELAPPVRHWTDQRIAGAAGAELVRGLGDRAGSGPARVVIDSRVVAPGDLFVALPGERVDGGEFAAEALRAGAWGVLAAPAVGARGGGDGRRRAWSSPPSIRSRRWARSRAPGGAISPRT